MIRLFRALDWLSRISGNQHYGSKTKHLTPTNVNFGYFLLKAITRQPIELEGCSKTPKDLECLVV